MKRMFSNAIIDSDLFLDLSPMAQLLYFHCGMKTDDDGFVSGARRIAKIIGANESDFQSLIDSGFLIEFPDSKVFVVVHHRLNNDLKNDRYHVTTYLREFDQLTLTENKSYIIKSMDTDCIQNVSKVSTEQNVTQRNPAEPSVTQDSGGEGSAEGGTRWLLLKDCQIGGLDPKKIDPLIDKYGEEKIHDALVKWKKEKQEPDQFESFIEMEG